MAEVSSGLQMGVKFYSVCPTTEVNPLAKFAKPLCTVRGVLLGPRELWEHGLALTDMAKALPAPQASPSRISDTMELHLALTLGMSQKLCKAISSKWEHSPLGWENIAPQSAYASHFMMARTPL